MSVKITFLGHSGFLLTSGEHTVAIDPFLSGSPVATMGPEDVECQTIVLTHGHADHFGDTVAISKSNGATVYAAFELAAYCDELGVPETKAMNPGGRLETDFGSVALTHAFHSSSHEGRYTGMPCGAVIEIGDKTIYHCGDTGIFGDMKLYGELYEPDVAMIPIGDRWTMGPKLASRAAEMIGPKIAIPIHYNTWPLIEVDPADFAPTGVAVKMMAPGEEWTYD